MNFTKSEAEIMETFWNENRPLSRAYLIKHATHQNWKNTSIHILLNSLLEKGAIEIVGFERTGRRIARTFAPTIGRAEYYTQWITSKDSFHEDLIPEMVSRLLEAASPSIVQQVREIVNNIETSQEGAG